MGKMLRIAICDDDTAFAVSLENAVIQEGRCMGIQAETNVFSDGETLLASMRYGYRYEMIFIDIEMEHVNGIDAARCIREIDRSVLIIYVSGYDQYLKELFEVEPFRFLSKPLDRDRFRRYFREACQRIWESDAFYQFTFNKEIRKVALKDVVYFESHNRVVHIFLGDGSSEQFYGKLNDVENSLANSRKSFLRIHQSFLVNYDYIKKMNFSSIIVLLCGKEMELKISEDRQKTVRYRLCEIAKGKAVVE
ncbi:LytR/AlgR family response regulator transcription factor [Clostridium sp. Marseille-P2415]|uniref:LytR/AlgR family response regulator transcription factor n=1 Tax=Clostridium sp. Marseille-P2415 TaxID=1805471 RepID=UPI001F36C98F|nr:LytTR family DNA-binding domain-containing protein [Clostridium sp. Marseille-P2415]